MYLTKLFRLMRCVNRQIFSMSRRFATRHFSGKLFSTELEVTAKVPLGPRSETLTLSIPTNWCSMKHATTRGDLMPIGRGSRVTWSSTIMWIKNRWCAPSHVLYAPRIIDQGSLQPSPAVFIDYLISPSATEKIVAGTAVAKIATSTVDTSSMHRLSIPSKSIYSKRQTYVITHVWSTPNEDGTLYSMKDKGGDGEKVYLMSSYAKEFTSQQLPMQQTVKRGDIVHDGVIVALVGKNINSLSPVELDLFVDVNCATLAYPVKPNDGGSSGSDFFIGLGIGHLLTKKD